MKLITLLKLIDGDVNIVVQQYPCAYKTLYSCSDAHLLLEYDRSSVSGLDVLLVTPCMKNDIDPSISILVKEAA